MSLQYVSDNYGRTTAVIIPIDEWNEVRKKHPDVDTLEGDIPQWQKDLLDQRLQAIKNNPESLRPIDELLRELDSED